MSPTLLTFERNQSDQEEGAASARLKILFGLVGLGLLGAYAVHGPSGARRIEAKVQAIATDELSRGGFGWAAVEADGRTIALSGQAPSDEGLTKAVMALRADHTGAIRRVDSARASIDAPAVAAPAAMDPEPAEQYKDRQSPGSVASVDAEIADDSGPPPEQSPQRQSECQTALNRALNGRRVTFQHNSAWLSARNRALLDDFAQEISPCVSQTIIIEGHTDSSGSSTINIAMSERRARSVKEYLDNKGDGPEFITKAYGDTRPIASNRTAAGQSANRRIDFVVVGEPLESD